MYQSLVLLLSLGCVTLVHFILAHRVRLSAQKSSWLCGDEDFTEMLLTKYTSVIELVEYSHWKTNCDTRNLTINYKAETRATNYLT